MTEIPWKSGMAICGGGCLAQPAEPLKVEWPCDSQMGDPVTATSNHVGAVATVGGARIGANSLSLEGQRAAIAPTLPLPGALC